MEDETRKFQELISPFRRVQDSSDDEDFFLKIKRSTVKQSSSEEEEQFGKGATKTSKKKTQSSSGEDSTKFKKPVEKKNPPSNNDGTKSEKKRLTRKTGALKKFSSSDEGDLKIKKKSPNRKTSDDKKHASSENDGIKSKKRRPAWKVIAPKKFSSSDEDEDFKTKQKTPITKTVVKKKHASSENDDIKSKKKRPAWKVIAPKKFSSSDEDEDFKTKQKTPITKSVDEKYASSSSDEEDVEDKEMKSSSSEQSSDSDDEVRPSSRVGESLQRPLTRSTQDPFPPVVPSNKEKVVDEKSAISIPQAELMNHPHLPHPIMKSDVKTSTIDKEPSRVIEDIPVSGCALHFLRKKRATSAYRPQKFEITPAVIVPAKAELLIPSAEESRIIPSFEEEQAKPTKLPNNDIKNAHLAAPPVLDKQSPPEPVASNEKEDFVATRLAGKSDRTVLDAVNKPKLSGRRKSRSVFSNPAIIRDVKFDVPDGERFDELEQESKKPPAMASHVNPTTTENPDNMAVPNRAPQFRLPVMGTPQAALARILNSRPAAPPISESSNPDTENNIAIHDRFPAPRKQDLPIFPLQGGFKKPREIPAPQAQPVQQDFRSVLKKREPK